MSQHKTRRDERPMLVPHYTHGGLKYSVCVALTLFTVFSSKNTHTACFCLHLTFVSPVSTIHTRQSPQSTNRKCALSTSVLKNSSHLPPRFTQTPKKEHLTLEKWNFQQQKPPPRSLPLLASDASSSYSLRNQLQEA